MSRQTTETDPRIDGRAGGFVVATISLLFVFAAGASSIPLYNTYQRVDHVTDTDFSIATVAYFVCAVFGLLVLGRLSNYLGRRPVTIAALLLAVAGTLTLTMVDGVTPLLIGRVLQGIAAGLATSAITAYVVDTAPQEPKWAVATITSAGPAVGLSIGVFASALLVEFAPFPRVLTYVVFAAILIVCVILISTRAETVQRRPGVIASLVPKLVIPSGAGRYLPVAASICFSTWALGGYVTAFGPSVAAGYLQSTSAVLAAGVFACYMAPTALGGPLSTRLRPAAAQRLGMLLLVIAVAGLITALVVGNAVIFIVAGVVGSIGQGMSTSANMRILLPQASPAQRAGLLAVIYAISYTGSSVPSLIAGQLSRSVSLLQITIGYGIMVLIAFLVVIVGARNPVAAGVEPVADSRP